jgi:PIN domain nuclease of toxin-antitoxin system
LGNAEEVKLLLDTHIWIWSSIEPDRLTKAVARELANPRNELWLSPISIWELSVLVRKHRIELDRDFDAWVAAALAQTAMREAPLTHDVAMEVTRIAFAHRDPADHFIAASAKVFGLTLVTADPRLIELRSKEIPILAN